MKYLTTALILLILSLSIVVTGIRGEQESIILARYDSSSIEYSCSVEYRQESTTGLFYVYPSGFPCEAEWYSITTAFERSRKFPSRIDAANFYIFMVSRYYAAQLAGFPQ